ncbi:MAG: DUF302 domain-containing protein [Bacteroidales bacterium]
MKNKVLPTVTLIFGFILGILFAGVAVSVSSGHMLVKELRSPYDFDKTVEVLTERINAKEGWRVTEVIDQNREVQAGGGEAIGNFKIVKYCSGTYSSRMLRRDDQKMMGNMMPKTFAVYQKSDGQVFISTMNGAVMGKIFGGEIETIIEEVSLEVEDMLRFVNLKQTMF